MAAHDSLGNLATSYAGNVSIAITGGTGTAGAHLGGTLTVTTVSGVAIFSGLSIDIAGTGYKLTATATGLASATSTAFNVTATAGPAKVLAFTTQPPNTTPGSPFAVAVTARDSLGNTATSFTGSRDGGDRNQPRLRDA